MLLHRPCVIQAQSLSCSCHPPLDCHTQPFSPCENARAPHTSDSAVCRFSCIDLNARGPGCFDDVFYNTENVDLHEKVEAGVGFDAGQAWHHFMHNGQFEGRHYRCTTCTSAVLLHCRCVYTCCACVVAVGIYWHAAKYNGCSQSRCSSCIASSSFIWVPCCLQSTMHLWLMGGLPWTINIESSSACLQVQGGVR